MWPFDNGPESSDVLDLGFVTITPAMRADEIPHGDKLGEGSYRVVHALGDDWVLKTPTFWSISPNELCIKANRLEVERYARFTEEDRVFFTQPIMWAPDHSWVIHERVTQGSYDVRWRSLDKLRPVADRYGIDDITGNTGFRGDQPVIFDYAGYIRPD